ncbi:hypothetical protein [Haliovirga abyssi]|uniref:Lipoprotein n=1 Tax=Haliovirga abyssi TaxID=2996794 RepID=A0AAU9DFN5_9FUSO|nr:hypothetical protein [Haliovirga abyssi]BDU51242.1 hypothetical protein HLVA_18110 [Haliovirga abyssi]
MKRRILLFILLLLVTSTLLTGCENKKEKARIKSLVMNELETRYDEKFEIRRIFYDGKRSKWVLEVYPKENNIDKETFFAFVKKDPKERVIENYSSIKEANLTTIYYKSIIKKIFKEKKLYFWGNMGIHIYDEKREVLKILKRKKFDFFFENIPNKMHVNIFILIFEDVVSTKKKKEAFIKEVWELFKYLKNQNLEWASITINIYDEDFFKDKDIDHILKVSNWFSSWTSEFDVTEYWKKNYAGLRIEEQDYYKIKSIKDIEKLLGYRRNYKK